MTLEVRQNSRNVNDNRWRWSVWLHGPARELDQVESVEYTLHPTFPDPVRTVSDRKTKFRLESSGWGEFKVRLKVHRKDGRVDTMEHWLTLSESGGGEPEDRTPRDQAEALFLSYPIAHGTFGVALINALEARQIAVHTWNDLAPGVPWEVGLRLLLQQVDAVVFMHANEPGSWVREEVRQAAALRLPILEVRLGAPPRRLEGLEEHQVPALAVSPSDDADRAAEWLAGQLRAILHSPRGEGGAAKRADEE